MPMAGDQEMGEEVGGCPACGATDWETIGGEAGAFCEDSGGRRFRQPPYVIRRCEQCDLYFKSRTMPPVQLDSYYAGLDSTTFDRSGDFPTDRYLRAQLDQLSSGSRVLDFGCSTGRILSPHTIRLQCLGVEPNRPAAELAGRRGIQIVREDRLPLIAGEGFDAIILADVYEHLARPVDLVQTLAALLKPGGWLAIVTGNADAIRPRDRLAEFWYFRLAGHLHMLSERHAGWLARRVGLDLDVLHRCSHYRTPIGRRVRQFIQAILYDQFHRSPRRAAAAVLRRIPRLRDAERWPTAPALTYRRDHVVAILRSPRSRCSRQPAGDSKPRSLPND